MCRPTVSGSSGRDPTRTGRTHTIAVPIRGGAVRNICYGDCTPRWSLDGKFFHASGLVFPVPAGRSLPDLPAAGIDEAGGAKGLPAYGPSSTG